MHGLYQGLTGLQGGGLAGMAQAQQDMYNRQLAQYGHAVQMPQPNVPTEFTPNKKKGKIPFRMELQSEIDEWLIG